MIMAEELSWDSKLFTALVVDAVVLLLWWFSGWMSGVSSLFELFLAPALGIAFAFSILYGFGFLISDMMQGFVKNVTTLYGRVRDTTGGVIISAVLVVVAAFVALNLLISFAWFPAATVGIVLDERKALMREYA